MNVHNTAIWKWPEKRAEWWRWWNGAEHSGLYMHATDTRGGKNHNPRAKQLLPVPYLLRQEWSIFLVLHARKVNKKQKTIYLFVLCMRLTSCYSPFADSHRHKHMLCDAQFLKITMSYGILLKYILLCGSIYF